MNEYLNIIYKYYPKDIEPSDLTYPNTAENVRLWEFIENARKNETENLNFENMVEMLTKYLNCEGNMNLSLRGVFDLCRKSVLYLPGNAHHEEYPCCVVNVSVLAKYYCIYFTKFTGVPINTLKTNRISEAQKFLVDYTISRIIKTYYPGYKEFPMEYFNERVPHVSSSKNYNENATFFECLITDDIL